MLQIDYYFSLSFFSSFREKSVNLMTSFLISHWRVNCVCVFPTCGISIWIQLKCEAIANFFNRLKHLYLVCALFLRQFPCNFIAFFFRNILRCGPYNVALSDQITLTVRSGVHANMINGFWLFYSHVCASANWPFFILLESAVCEFNVPYVCASCAVFYEPSLFMHERRTFRIRIFPFPYGKWNWRNSFVDLRLFQHHSQFIGVT